MSESNKCRFCGGGNGLKSDEGDEIYYLNPESDYVKNIRHDYHANVQVDINDSKYPDARIGDDTNATFWFNYCPECGRKLR